MPSVTGECKAYRTKMLLVVTCLTGLVMLCPACSLVGTNEIATVDSGCFVTFNIDRITGHTTYLIGVGLTPTDIAQPYTIYQVDLYEKGQFRATTTVSWNQLELNVLEKKSVVFPASQDEYHTYFFKDISNIFSVKIHESQSTGATQTPAASVVIYEITGTADKVFVSTLITPDGHIEQYRNVEIPIQYVYSSFPFYFVGLCSENEGIEGSVTVSIYVDGNLYATSTNSGDHAKASACGPIAGSGRTDCY
jgi:hypothetical protein